MDSFILDFSTDFIWIEMIPRYRLRREPGGVVVRNDKQVLSPKCRSSGDSLPDISEADDKAFYLSRTI